MRLEGDLPRLAIACVTCTAENVLPVPGPARMRIGSVAWVPCARPGDGAISQSQSAATLATWLMPALPSLRRLPTFTATPTAST